MALTKNMSLQQIKSFLENELKEQIFLEVAPILYIGQESGGYFGVTRQILCLVNFLGALYYGYSPDEKKKKSDIGPSWKALEFMKNIMSDVDPIYKSKEAEYFYEMYRHGLIHLYQPKTLKLKGRRKLNWFLYKGGRNSHTETINDEYGNRFKIPNVSHLRVLTYSFGGNPNKDFLSISITCLYKDLLTSIDIFYNKIEKDKVLLKHWRQTANAISEPVSYPKA